MQYKVKYIFFIILIFIFVACNHVYIYAAESGNKIIDKTQQSIIKNSLENKAEEEALAVVVVMDTSKSMATTDPYNFRKTASNIFIDLLNAEDYLGIITFNHEITVVQQLSKVKNYENKTKIKNNLLPYFETNGNTDYQKALESAADQLNQIEDVNVKKAILFITDGEPDPNPEKSIEEPEYMNTYMESMWNTVDELSTNLYPVYSIGFSEGIESDILNQISTNTGGTFQILTDSNSLTTSIFEMYGKITNRLNLIDKSIDLNENSKFSTVIDKKTIKLTMLLLGDVKSTYEVEVINPDNKIMNDKCNLIVNEGYTIVDINSNDKKLSTEGNYLSKGTWKLRIKGEGIIHVFGNMDVLDAERDIPTLVHDFYINDEGYRIGEKVRLTSSLVKGVGRMQEGNGFEIDHYYVVIKNTSLKTNSKPFTLKQDFKLQKFELFDDGLKIHNDLIKGDGIWSNSITFTKEGISSASFLVNGTYNSDSFTINENIGTFKVSNIGRITITPIDNLKDINNANNSIDKKVLYVKNGGTLTIPVKIENSSWFLETLNLSVSGGTGNLQHSSITLKPREVLEYPIKLDFLKDKKNTVDSIQDIKITFQPEYTATTINKNELTIKVQIKSSYKLNGKNVRDYIANVKTQFLFVFLVIIIFILNGRILYYIFFHHLKYVNGILTFYLKNEEDPVKTNLIFCFPGLNKKSLVVSFNIDNPEIDYYIGGTNFDYDIIISTNYSTSKLCFLEGWKALFNNAKPVYYSVSTTIPGIIEKDGQVFTKMKLADNEIFETGDYFFLFSLPRNCILNKK